MAEFWSRCLRGSRCAVLSHPKPRWGSTGKRLSLGLSALLLGCLVLGMVLLWTDEEARGARGTIHAQARVLERCAPVEADRARSELRREIHEMRQHRGQPLPTLTQVRIAPRELDGGRLRLRYEGSAETGHLTVEYLAN